MKRGFSYGATDEFGLTAVENRVHVHDFHATTLHLMGIDHERLTYRYSGSRLSTDGRARKRHSRCHRLGGCNETKSAFFLWACDVATQGPNRSPVNDRADSSDGESQALLLSNILRTALLIPRGIGLGDGRSVKQLTTLKPIIGILRA